MPSLALAFGAGFVAGITDEPAVSAGPGEAIGLDGRSAAGVASGDCSAGAAPGRAALSAKMGTMRMASAQRVTARIIARRAGFDNRPGSCYKRAYLAIFVTNTRR